MTITTATEKLEESSVDAANELSANKEDKKLKNAWQLFKEAFGLYCAKFRTVIGIMIVPVIVSILLDRLTIISISSPALSQASWISAVKVIIWLISIYANIISSCALLFSVKEDIGAKEAYIKAIKNGFSYIVVVLLVLLVVVGGCIFLLGPGIVFMILLSLATYAFVFENKKGMKALHRSKQLVLLSFPGVLWRFFLAFFIVIVLSLPFIIGEEMFNIPEEYFTDIIFNLTIGPFLAFFGLLLFQDLVKLQIKKLPSLPVSRLGRLEKFGYYFWL